MTNLFLKAKHWQLFLAMIVMPIAVQFYWLFDFFRFQQQISEPNTDSEGFTQVLNEQFYQLDYFPFVMIGFSLLFLGWFWSIATGLQKTIPADIKMKVRKFKIFFLIPVFYILFLMLFISGMFSGIAQSFFLNGGGVTMIAIILPLHLFSMFCIFYSMYFVAKTIKTAELQRETGFGDFIGEFFLLWFYFVGIWIIQPKVNRLYKGK